MVYEESVRCGKVLGIAVPVPPADVADDESSRVYIKFATSGDAAKCKEMMDGRLFDEGKVRHKQLCEWVGCGGEGGGLPGPLTAWLSQAGIAQAQAPHISHMVLQAGSFYGFLGRWLLLWAPGLLVIAGLWARGVRSGRVVHNGAHACERANVSSCSCAAGQVHARHRVRLHTRSSRGVDQARPAATGVGIRAAIQRHPRPRGHPWPASTIWDGDPWTAWPGPPQHTLTHRRHSYPTGRRRASSIPTTTIRRRFGCGCVAAGSAQQVAAPACEVVLRFRSSCVLAELLQQCRGPIAGFLVLLTDSIDRVKRGFEDCGMCFVVIRNADSGTTIQGGAMALASDTGQRWLPAYSIWDLRCDTYYVSTVRTAPALCLDGSQSGH